MRDAYGHPQTALVLGGGSDIALATIRHLARQRLARVALAARRPAELEERLRAEPLGVELAVEAWDALDAEAHGPLLERVQRRIGDIDLVLCAVGSLGHHSGLEVGAAEAQRSIETNFAGPAAALLEVGRFLARQGHGTIVVLSSVAGVRARRSNFVYGAGKAGLDTFAQGLGDALVGTGVRVHIVRPGFVSTKMTAGLPPAPFATEADTVAAAIADALASPRNRVVWVPGVLRAVFTVLRNLPVPLWRRVAGER